MNFDDRIRKYEYKLNETDIMIIAFIEEHRTDISNFSIKDIAGTLFIAPNAIMRLSKKLGYSGFAELKALLNAEDSTYSDDFPYNISKTLDLIDKTILNEVAAKIKECKTVYIFGVGDSVYFADMMWLNLKVLDKPAESHHYYDDIEYRVQNCMEDDLVIFISAKGNNEKLLEYARDLKDRGITTVSVTHFDENELSRLSDYSLYFWGEERTVSGYDVSDRTGLMIVLRALSEIFWRTYCV